ncbi:MAG: hypothetical protein IMF18_03125 [Proteobacteria bacterium]|nr:hypothetical protein [Pseudomonadota bacterium]
MGGRFGKYGDTKRKALIRKNRLRNPVGRLPRKPTLRKGFRKGQMFDRLKEGAVEVRNKGG